MHCPARVVLPDARAGRERYAGSVGDVRLGHDVVRDYRFTTNGSGDYGPKQTTGYYGGPGGSPPGYGRITGTVAGVSGSCYGNWKDGGPCS